MKVFMIGGTGLLGCEAATVLIEKGHEVKSVALPPLPEGAPIPEKMELEFCNINLKTDEEVEEMMKGCDVFVYAAGIDERREIEGDKGAAYAAYKKFNIDPIARLIPICKKVGMKKAVVLGSYFSYLYKITNGTAEAFEPISKKQIKGLKGFLDRNSYIKSRIDQEEVAKSFVDDNFDVTVLELPYIFGTQPGRKPVWTILIEQIAFMDKLPFTMYPGGGTAMLTVHQVGQTIAGAALEEAGKGFQALPIGMYNLDWKTFLGIVYDARNMPGRKIVSVAPWMMKMGMGGIIKDYEKRHIDSGMDPLQLPYVMDYNLFIDPQITKNLGVEDADIKAAIFDSITVSQASYDGKVKLLEMKGE